jgi:transcriptional regulator with XRE-family HTH domain
MTASEKRSRFSAAIRKALSERNETAADLAKAISASPSTVRTWLNRHRFPKDKAEAIAAHLGWNLTAEEIEARFDVGVWAQAARQQAEDAKTLYQLFQEHEKSALRLFELLYEAQPKLIPLIQAMQKGDVYIHITFATLPPESLPEFDELRLAIAKAIRRNAFLIYIVPSEALHQRWLDDFSLKTANNAPSLEAFLGTVTFEAQRLLKTFGESEERAREIVAKQIIIVQADEFPWFSPGTSYSVFASVNNVTKEPMHRILLSLPGDYGGRLVLPRIDMLTLRMVMAAFRHVLGKITALQFSEIAIFDYLAENPGPFY